MSTEESGQDQPCVDVNPWDDLTSDQFCTVLESAFVADPFPISEHGQVFRPAEPLSVQSALLAALPKTVNQEDAADWLGDTGGPEQLLSYFGGSDWVISCEVINSMVSGIWGLREFHVGGRGYLYERPDEDLLGEGLPIFGAWAPFDNAASRLACICAVHAREWDQRGWPPYISIERVSGDFEALLEALLHTLSTAHGRAEWSQVVDVAGGELTIQQIEHAASLSHVPMDVVEKYWQRLAAGDPRLEEQARSGTAELVEQRGIVALYLERLWD